MYNVYCTLRHCTVLYSTLLYDVTKDLDCSVLYCTVLHFTIQYCTVLYCITKDLELVGLLYGLCLTLHLADVVTSIVYVQVADVQVNAWKIFHGVKNILSMLNIIISVGWEKTI